MTSNVTTGRIVGGLLLIIFVLGVLMYQFLQGAILFGDDYLTETALNAHQIILSTLVGFSSGTLSIIVAAILLPIFKKYNYSFAFLYLALTVVYFVILAIDNISVLALLEFSKAYSQNGINNPEALQSVGTVFYETHWWTHYSSLLISCLPVFVFYFILFRAKLIPKAIAIFGLFAVVLMFTEMLFSFLGQSISMNMLLPIGLVQLLLPIWLIIKGFNPHSETKLN